MKTDHFYAIGYSHDECQDYALSRIWDNGLAFACVADGCSSSHDRCRGVDVGARILSLSADYVLEGLSKKHTDISKLDDSFYKNNQQPSLGDLIATFAKNSIDHLMRPSDSEYALDSTLLLAVADEKDALIFVFGDGIVSVEYMDGSKDVFEVNFSNGAPYYLSYTKDEGRNEVYESLNNHMKINDIGDLSGATKCSVVVHPDGELKKYYSWPSLRVKDYKRISLMSDGFSSFDDAEDNAISTAEMVSQATSFKNPIGVFTQRRLKTMLRKLERTDISHYDDLSIASIVRE